MKYYTSIFAALCLICFATACNNNNQKSTAEDIGIDLEDAIANAESRRAADPSASGGNTCLLDYQKKYDQLLTEEMVLNITGFSKDAIEVKYSKVMDNPEYHSISYRFANGRPGEFMGRNVILSDKIKLEAIKPMSLNQFKNTYRVISKQETDDSNKAIDDALEGKSESEEANQKAKEVEQMGVSKETTKGVTSSIKDVFSKVSNSYFNVDGLGDAATWNSFTNELNVLKNGVQFKLTVDVNKEDLENKKVAVEIARKILEKCN